MEKRVNGFIDLDEYFYEITGKYITDLDDLYSLGLADAENEGLYDKFWFSYNGDSVLYKDTPYHSCAPYAELIAEELAKSVNIPTAHYDLATFRGRKGVISYQFYYPQINIVSGEDILSEYLGKYATEEGFCLNGIDTLEYSDAMEEVNCLEHIWLALEERYKDREDRDILIPTLMTSIVDILIFDTITLQSDRHACNWCIIEDGDEIRVAPIYDNCKLGNLSVNNLLENSSKENVARLTADNNPTKGSSIEVIKRFIELSSSIYHDRIINQLDTIETSITGAIENVESRVSSKMPIGAKEEYISDVLNNINNIRGLIQPEFKEDGNGKTKC